MDKKHPNLDMLCKTACESWELFWKRFCSNFVSVKSVVFIALVIGLIFLLSGEWNPSDPIRALFTSALSAMITYYFTKTKEDDK